MLQSCTKPSIIRYAVFSRVLPPLCGAFIFIHCISIYYDYELGDGNMTSYQLYDVRYSPMENVDNGKEHPKSQLGILGGMLWNYICLILRHPSVATSFWRNDDVIITPCVRWDLSFWETQKQTPVHYNDVIMGVMASQITSLTVIYSTFYSGADQRTRVIGLCEGNSPVTGKFPKMFPFDDVIMNKSAKVSSLVTKYISMA